MNERCFWTPLWLPSFPESWDFFHEIHALAAGSDKEGPFLTCTAAALQRLGEFTQQDFRAELEE